MFIKKALSFRRISISFNKLKRFSTRSSTIEKRFNKKIKILREVRISLINFALKNNNTSILNVEAIALRELNSIIKNINEAMILRKR